MTIKGINFKQPKYMLPAILYPLLLFLGYQVIDLFFNTEKVSVEEKSNLQTTEYLNAELPSAKVSDELGSKRDNVRKMFGSIVDRTAVDGVESDLDSLNAKEGYDTKYTDEERKLIDEQEAQRQELADLRKQLQEAKEKAERAEKEKLKGSKGGTATERREDLLNELDAELNNMLVKSGVRGVRDSLNALSGGAGGTGATDGSGDVVAASSGAAGTTGGRRADGIGADGKSTKGGSVLKDLADDAEDLAVSKEVDSESSYFSTVSGNSSESEMIRAIIDEEVKAVNGSRVRLRLLDNIVIGTVTLKRGTYLYATMSGFGSQRVKGNVQSVMVGDNIMKINLAIYDTDGLEGLYVPQSSFRETAKEIGSSALSGGSSNLIENNYGGSSVTSMATQAISQAYQRTTQAISKAIRKNKVRLKYGTHVYLLNKNTKTAAGGDSRPSPQGGGGISRLKR